jgi:hypothetical protein
MMCALRLKAGIGAGNYKCKPQVIWTSAGRPYRLCDAAREAIFINWFVNR